MCASLCVPKISTGAKIHSYTITSNELDLEQCFEAIKSVKKTILTANVPFRTLGPRRGTLCLQTFVLSGTRKRSDKPSKLTILVWRLVYFNSFYLLYAFYLRDYSNAPVFNL